MRLVSLHSIDYDEVDDGGCAGWCWMCVDEEIEGRLNVDLNQIWPNL